MSYVQYLNNLDIEKVESAVKKRIEDQKKYLNLMISVLPVLEKWNGKAVNKRLAVDITKVIGGVANCWSSSTWSVFVRKAGDWWTLFIYDGNGKKYEISLYSTHVQGRLDIENHGLKTIIENVKLDIKKHEYILPRLPELVDKWNSALDCLKAINQASEGTLLNQMPFFDTRQ